MRQLILALVLGLSMKAAMAAPSIYVFVSFSMPEQLLTETLRDAATLHIPAILNGLIDNSMPKTVQKIMALSNKVPNLNLQIDPTAFERFEIKQVPALVVANLHAFDVLYGNGSLFDALLRIAGQGESGLTRLDVQELSA
ncbi:MAG: type-F conjugative transfer system pilin assembly protein TrbC [Pseudomonadota bacterium]